MSIKHRTGVLGFVAACLAATSVSAQHGHKDSSCSTQYRPLGSVCINDVTGDIVFPSATALVRVAATAALAQHGAHMITTPDDLKWEDVAALPPGAKIAVIEGKMNQAGPITARVKLPANYKIPPHFHPVQERVTVLSGTMNIGMGDKFDAKKTTAMKPGTVLLMEPEMHHFAWTSEETIFQLNVTGPWGVTYLDPADDPRKKK